MQSCSTTMKEYRRSIFTYSKTSVINRKNIAYLSQALFIAIVLKFPTNLLHDGQVQGSNSMYLSTGKHAVERLCSDSRLQSSSCHWANKALGFSDCWALKPLNSWQKVVCAQRRHAAGTKKPKALPPNWD